MYKILVVDDEPLIRDYLQRSIHSFHSDFEVAATARDGVEAIEYINRYYVDVVITDIKMPEIDGLTLSKYIFDNFPGLITIIVSGFNEFEYARRAITYQVKDYLLKPLKDNDLKALLLKIAAELEAHSRTRHSQFILRDSDGDNEKLVLLREVLDQNFLDNPELCGRYQSLDYPIMDSYGCIVQCLPLCRASCSTADQAHHMPSEIDIRLFSICYKRNISLLFGKNGSAYMLLEGSTPDSLEQTVSALEALLNKDADLCGGMILFCGKPVSDFISLTESYKSIEEMLPLIVLSNKAVFFYREISAHKSSLAAVKRLGDILVIDYLAKNNDKLFMDIRLLFGAHLSSFTSKTLSHMICYLVDLIIRTNSIDDTFISAAFYHMTSICLSNKDEEIGEHKLVVAAFDTLILLSRGSAEGSSHEMPAVRKAKEFILLHYQDNISLADVADFCGVGVSYLSNLFHKQLHISYSKYLNLLRMEQAARLLRSYPDIRIYDVAARTGFLSPKHFITVFKSYYGMSPASYQRLLAES